MEEDGGHAETCRKRTRGAPPPRDVTPPGLKRPPPPREEGDPYDELLDYDSDTYEYRWNRRRTYRLSESVFVGKYTGRPAGEVARDWELITAERRRFLSSDEPLRLNRRPRFAGLGSVEERPPIYRQAALTNEGSDVGVGSGPLASPTPRQTLLLILQNYIKFLEQCCVP